jgi:hypothetical protein
MAEQVVGAREARIARIHHRGGNAGEAQRSARALDVAREWMRRVRRLGAR